jgi:RNA polymerase sigma-70 factor (ECF subfamily)
MVDDIGPNPSRASHDIDEKRRRDQLFADEALIHLADVTRFALSLTRDEADAEDLVQETYLRAYQSWDTYTPGTECRGWLFTICRHTNARQRRRDQRVIPCDDPELESLAAAAIHTAAATAGLGDVFARADLRDAIDLALERLPEQFREVIILVDIQDQSYEDTAAVMGVPVGTVRSRLFRGRRLLQEALIDHARDLGLAPLADRGGESRAESWLRRLRRRLR